MTHGAHYSILLAAMALLLAGCDLTTILPTTFQFPTLTPQPTGSPTRTLKPTVPPTATPTRVTPAAVGTALAQAQVQPGITESSLTLLAEWGSGLPQQAAWSPDGAWLGVASSRGVQVYDAETWKLERVLLRGELVRSLAFAPDGERLAAGMDSGEVALFDLLEGRQIWRLTLASKPVLSLALSPDGEWLAVGAVDGGINLWRAEDGSLARMLGSHVGAIQQATFIRDGEFLLTWSPREQPYLWRLRDGRRMDDFYIGANPGGGSAAELSVSAEGGVVAAAQGARLRLLRGSDNTTLATINAFSSPVLAVAASADGSVVAAAMDGEVQVWSSQPAELLLRLLLSVPAESVHLALSPDGAQLAVLEDRLKRWDIGAGEETAQSATVYATDFQLAGVLDATANAWWSGASDGALQAWELQAGEPSGAVFPLGVRPAALVYSPKSGWAAAAQGVKVLVWQAADDGSAALRFTLTGHKLGVTSLALSPDGRWLASGSADGTVRLWELKGGSPGEVLEVGDAVGWVMFSPAGERLAACAQQRIRVWNTASGRLVDEFDGYALAFQPGGELLAAAGFEDRQPVVRLRSVGQAAPLAVLPVRAHRLSFSPEGDLLLSAGDELSLFSIPGGERLARTELDTSLRDAVFLPGGTRVLGAAWDGVLTIYGAP